MKLLLDTSVIVASERRDLQLEVVIGDDDDVAISAITIAELLLGAHLGGKSQATRRVGFVEQLKEILAIEPYDEVTAREHAELLAATRRTGRPRGAHDLIIAATARATGRTVVTLDPGGFEGLPGVEVRSG